MSWLWDIATSDLSLSLLGLVAFAAAVVGWFPLLKYIPAIGPYVPVARLVAVLLLVSISFLLGFRTSDERENVERLRATLAARDADIAIAAKSTAFLQARVNEIEAAADVQRGTDADYIASLQSRPACVLTDADLRGLRGVRVRSSGRDRPSTPSGAR